MSCKVKLLLQSLVYSALQLVGFARVTNEPGVLSQRCTTPASGVLCEILKQLQSECYAYLYHTHTCVSILGMCNKQTAKSHSSAESEII